MTFSSIRRWYRRTLQRFRDYYYDTHPPYYQITKRKKQVENDRKKRNKR